MLFEGEKHLKPPISVSDGLSFHIIVLVLLLKLSVRGIRSGYVLIKVNLLRITTLNEPVARCKVSGAAE